MTYAKDQRLTVKQVKQKRYRIALIQELVDLAIQHGMYCQLPYSNIYSLVYYYIASHCMTLRSVPALYQYFKDLLVDSRIDLRCAYMNDRTLICNCYNTDYKQCTFKLCPYWRKRCV